METYTFTKSGVTGESGGNGSGNGGNTGVHATVNFTGPRDETITVTQIPGAGSLTVSVSDQFTKYRWFLDGVLLKNETKSSLSLDVSELSLKQHELTVFVTSKNSVEYAKALRFTLER
jgi:hypothetical protein